MPISLRRPRPWRSMHEFDRSKGVRQSMVDAAPFFSFYPLRPAATLPEPRIR
jgi:hypothetical protein